MDSIQEIILFITMWVVTVCTYISYIPQIIKLLRTKHSEDLSITSWILLTISSLANTLYSLILGRIELIIASVLETLLILIVLILTIYYKIKECKVKKLKSQDNSMVFVGSGVGKSIHNIITNNNKCK